MKPGRIGGSKTSKPPKLISTTGKVRTSNDSATGAGKAPAPPVGGKVGGGTVPAGTFGNPSLGGGRRKGKKGY